MLKDDRFENLKMAITKFFFGQRKLHTHINLWGNTEKATTSRKVTLRKQPLERRQNNYSYKVLQ